MSFALGRGLKLHPALLPQIDERLAQGEFQLTSQLDWMEFDAEDFMGRNQELRQALLKIAEILPMVCRSRTLSIGGTDPLDPVLLSALKELTQETQSQWVSAPLGYSVVSGVQLYQTLPLPWNQEAITTVVQRTQEVQEFLELPISLENIPSYCALPESEIPEGRFISEILEQSGAFLSLNLTHLYVNFFNQSEADLLRTFLKQLPLKKILAVKAGGLDCVDLKNGNLLLSSLAGPVPQPVQSLLKDLHQLNAIKTLLLERERDIPRLDELLREVDYLWKNAWTVKQDLKQDLKQDQRLDPRGDPKVDPRVDPRVEMKRAVDVRR